MRKLLVLLVVALLPSLSPEARAASLFSMSTKEEVAVGRNIAKSIEKQLPILRNSEYETRLARVGHKLASVSDRKDLEYHFTVIDKDQINAFATFGGHIYVYKGVLDKAETDDELAAILAHEIGHVSAKHLAQMVEKDRAFSLGFSLLDAFILRKQKARRDIRRIINLSYSIIRRGYTREDEIEADKLGARYGYRAGYDPLAAVSMLSKLKKEEAKKGYITIFENIDILRTHPYIDDRIDTVISEVAAIKAEEAFLEHSKKELIQIFH